MLSQIYSNGPLYASPEVELILLNAENLLCMSITSGGEGNGFDDLEPGEDWGGDLL